MKSSSNQKNRGSGNTKRSAPRGTGKGRGGVPRGPRRGPSSRSAGNSGVSSSENSEKPNRDPSFQTGSSKPVSAATASKRPPRNRTRERVKFAEYQPREPVVYGVAFFDSLAAAKAALPELRSKAAEVGQLNIVIRQESDMNDPELREVGRVYAGSAWTTIHERRVEEGWYNEPH